MQPPRNGLQQTRREKSSFIRSPSAITFTVTLTLPSARPWNRSNGVCHGGPSMSRILVARIYRVGEALLWLKEIEYLGRPQEGEIADRLQRLIDKILTPMEQEWRNGKSESTTVARVKQLRMAILPEMVAEEVTEEEKKRRWDQLTDMYVAQQMGHYPPHYVRSNPDTMRMLETVERFEEDLTDVSRIHRPMSATVQIGKAIPVRPKRQRGTSEDPLLAALDQTVARDAGDSVFR